MGRCINPSGLIMLPSHHSLHESIELLGTNLKILLGIDECPIGVISISPKSRSCRHESKPDIGRNLVVHIIEEKFFRQPTLNLPGIEGLGGISHALATVNARSFLGHSGCNRSQLVVPLEELPKEVVLPLQSRPLCLIVGKFREDYISKLDNASIRFGP